MIVWQDGQIYPAEEVRISPLDHGFLYGVGFFETFRTYQGKLYAFENHYHRLRQALAEYAIDFPYSIHEVVQWIQQLEEASEPGDGYYRLNVSAGVHSIGLTPKQYEKPTILVFRRPLQPVLPLAAKTASWLKTPRNSKEGEQRHKSQSFLNNVRGRLELPSLQQQEGFFLTEKGDVCEGVTSSIFWINDNVLYTPCLTSGCLAGTTRAHVLQLAPELDLLIEEGLFSRSCLEQADEVFITNAIQGIVSIQSVEHRAFLGVDGPWTQQLHQLYTERIDQAAKELAQWN